MLVYLPRRHSRHDRLVSDEGVSAIVVIHLWGHDGVELMFDDVDELDDATFHSLHDDIVRENQQKVRSERQHELEHAKHEAMPFPVVYELVGLRSAFLVSHQPDGVNDESDVSGGPMDLTVAVQPMDFHQHRLSHPSPILNRPDLDSDSRAHDGDLCDDAACISFH